MGLWARDPVVGWGGGTVSLHAGCTLNSIIEMAMSPCWVLLHGGNGRLGGGGWRGWRGGTGEIAGNTFLAVPVQCVLSLRDCRVFQETETVTYPSVSRCCSSSKMDV